MRTTTFTPADEDDKEYEVDFVVCGVDHDFEGRAYPETEVVAVRELVGDDDARELDLDGADREWWEKNKRAVWDETARAVMDEDGD